MLCLTILMMSALIMIITMVCSSSMDAQLMYIFAVAHLYVPAYGHPFLVLL